MLLSLLALTVPASAPTVGATAMPLHVPLARGHDSRVPLSHDARILTGGAPAIGQYCADDDYPEECAALVALADGTNFTTWERKENWLTKQSYCTWQGVYCNNQSHVWLLQLHTNNLRGQLGSFDAFSEAKYISLHHNQLIGTLPDLGGLPHLETLSVGFNALGGTLPSLSGNPLLQTFKAESNNFIGTMPSLAQNKLLVDLYLNDNQLEGSIPPISANRGLREFYAHRNQLTGDLPDLSQNSNLQFLRLAVNNLTGTVPPLQHLTDLETLVLHTNRLKGHVPEVQQLTKLDRLLLQGNEMTGTLPQLPPLVHFLDVSHNKMTNFHPSICDHQLSLSLPAANCLAEKNLFPCESVIECNGAPPCGARAFNKYDCL